MEAFEITYNPDVNVIIRREELVDSYFTAWVLWYYLNKDAVMISGRPTERNYKSFQGTHLHFVQDSPLRMLNGGAGFELHPLYRDAASISYYGSNSGTAKRINQIAKDYPRIKFTTYLNESRDDSYAIYLLKLRLPDIPYTTFITNFIGPTAALRDKVTVKSKLRYTDAALRILPPSIEEFNAMILNPQFGGQELLDRYEKAGEALYTLKRVQKAKQSLNARIINICGLDAYVTHSLPNEVMWGVLSAAVRMDFKDTPPRLVAQYTDTRTHREFIVWPMDMFSESPWAQCASDIVKGLGDIPVKKGTHRVSFNVPRNHPLAQA